MVDGTANSLSAIDAALKQLYIDSNEAGLFFDERPAFGLIPKDESMAGRNTPEVVYFARTGGRSADFASAQTLAAARDKKVEDFLLTAVDDYSLVRVPGKTLAMARNREGAWDMLVSSLAGKAFDDAENNLSDAIELYMYRDAKGWVAKVKSVNTTTKVITLDDAETALLFELGDRIKLSSTKGGTLETDVFSIIGIDTIAGTVTYSVITGADSAITADDFIHQLGDGANNGANVKLSGFEAWIPTTTPAAAESFFGVDRSVSSRLYGKYIDNSSVSREQALLRAATTLAKEGGAPTVGLQHYVQQRALIEELGLRKEIVDMNPVSERGLVANIGFRGVAVQGPHSVLRMVPTVRGYSNEAVLIRPEDWKLLSAGPALSLEDHDGLTIARLPNDDGYEGRMVFRGNLECKKPGRQARVKLAAA